jgi:hypothetical protein
LLQCCLPALLSVLPGARRLAVNADHVMGGVAEVRDESVAAAEKLVSMEGLLLRIDEPIFPAS